MKNIRSKSIAALSIVLLLSTVSVRAYEMDSKDLAEYVNAVSAPAVEVVTPVQAPVLAVPAVEVVAPVLAVPVEAVAPVSVQPVVESKGFMSSARNYVSNLEPRTWHTTVINGVTKARSSVGSAVKSAIENRPTTLAEARTMVQEHPVIAGVTAAAVLGATGLVAYKTTQSIKAKRALNATIAKIETQIKAIDSAITQNQAVDTTELVLLIAQIPASNKTLVDALVAYSNAATQGNFVALNQAVDSLTKLGLNLNAYTPTLREKASALFAKASALVPTKQTVAKAAAATTLVAAVPAAIAYDKGYFDGAINAGSKLANAGSSLAKGIWNTIANVNYAGGFAKANNAVVKPVINFAMKHPVALTAAAGVSALGITLYVKRDAIKQAAQTRKANAARQAKLEADINAAKQA